MDLRSSCLIYNHLFLNTVEVFKRVKADLNLLGLMVGAPSFIRPKGLKTQPLLIINSF